MLNFGQIVSRASRCGIPCNGVLHRDTFSLVMFSPQQNTDDCQLFTLGIGGGGEGYFVFSLEDNPLISLVN